MLLPVIYPVTCNTQYVGPGSTFVAIKGFKEDGAIYIHKAISMGATTIIVDRSYIPYDIPPHIKIIFVDDTRKALALYAAQALGEPAKKLKIIGITGTAGKTTTTFIIDHLLTSAGYKTALMGSIKNKIDREEEEASLTSPSADYIQMFLSECVKQSIDYVIMEVSSHSIALSRIYGIEFSGIGFTNLSAEHMDFHETMTHYFETKTMLFNQLQQNGIIVINTDNEWGKKAIKSTATNLHKPKVFSFGANVRNSTQKNELYYTFIVEQNNINGLLLTINLKTHIRCSYLFGAFNAYNICMAYLICTHLGVSESILQSGLSTFTGVSGRLQLHTLKNGAKAFVDYAHKPGAFQAVLTTLRPLSTDLIVVFGCGGDRDKTKRPIMGKLAVDYADLVIITDDNPRNEDQHAIIRDIMAGISEEKMNKVIIELDRKKAITIAAHKSCQDSIIAILGKGHENYHLVKGKKHHFDDLEAIRFF